MINLPATAIANGPGTASLAADPRAHKTADHLLIAATYIATNLRD
jgi:hypothetical protein